MHGVWGVYGTLVSLGLARASISIIWSLISLVLWIWIPKLLPNRNWPEIGRIHLGVLLLLCWYAASTVDLWLHQEQAYVPYGYIITAPVWEIPRIASNIIFLWGTLLIVWRDLEAHFESPTIWQQVGRTFYLVMWLFYLVMWLLALYYIGLFISLVLVWEFFADTTVIEDIAWKRNGFETAFSFLQFFFAFFLVCGSALSGYFWRRHDGRLPMQVWLQFGAALALFARSFSELIIVASYGGSDGPTVNSMALARDVAFGLFTVIFLGFICACPWSVARLDAGDPRVLDARKMVRQWVLDHLRQVTQNGRLPPPPFPTVVSNFTRFISGNTGGRTGHEADQAYIRDLKIEYANDLEGEFGHHVGQQ